MDATPPTNVVEYHPMAGCESDDSQSSISRSDEIDPVPGIIYTSDDSADVGQSDSTYADSDGANYIAQFTNINIGDEISQELLLDSEQTSPQPSPRINQNFIIHPLTPVHFIDAVVTDDINRPASSLLTEKLHLAVPNKCQPEVPRSNSSSTISTERSETESNNFLSEYQRLSSYAEEDVLMNTLDYNKIYDDPVKSQAITERHRWYVGAVHIDAKYKDAFYVRWNWNRIRQSFALLHASFLIVLLCLGTGLLIQMPRGNECDPVQNWWQGSVSYEIFVPSFQDSDGDGVGDVRGIIDRLSYLEELGVRCVQLSALFDWKLSADSVRTNLRAIDPVMGHQHDVQLLAALLHERNMFLLLELPLVSQGASNAEEAYPLLDLLEEVPGVLTNWSLAGVDGFVLTGLEDLHSHPLLPLALNKWRHTLDHSPRNINQRVMVVPLQLFKRLKQAGNVDVATLLPVVDLVYVHFEMSQSAAQLAKFIEECTVWDDHVSYPWLLWKVGGVGQRRLADLVRVEGEWEGSTVGQTLGAIILQLFLPGSVSIYYGDEIGLSAQHTQQTSDWASVMQWSDAANGGFSSGEPWLALNSDWKTRNVELLNGSLNSVREMITASQNEVPIYINGIFKDEGDYHPKKSANYKIRHSKGDLLVLDRFYPRRSKFAVAINLGTRAQTWDISQLFFWGQVLASSHDKQGQIDFKNLLLQPREALAFYLD